MHEEGVQGQSVPIHEHLSSEDDSVRLDSLIQLFGDDCSQPCGWMGRGGGLEQDCAIPNNIIY